MKLSTWNIRRGNDPLKQQEVLDFLHTTRVDILGVLETRIKEKNSKAILTSQFHAYKVPCNYKYHVNCRIWLILRPATVSIHPLIIHAQFIHCVVTHHATCQQYHFTVVYASNDAQERTELWAALSAISLTVNSCIFWETLMLSGVSLNGSVIPLLIWRIFWISILSCFSVVWMISKFPATSVNFLPAGMSDHSPLLVTAFEDKNIGSRFSFLNYWVNHPDYHSIVKTAWDNPVQGSNTYKFLSKLKEVKFGLKSSHKQHYSSITQKVCSAKEKLHKCQVAIQGNTIFAALLDQEKSLLDHYVKLKTAEGNILKQKAKLEHISQNDSSTKYFYARIQERKQQQIIGQIKDMNGHDRFGLDNVGHAFTEYYEHLLGTATPIAPLDVHFIQQGKLKKKDGCIGGVTKGYVFKLLIMRHLINKPIEHAEIREPIFEIGSDKSPGPDSFSSAFFNASWDTIGLDFCKAGKAFF
ncbi:uncharacterized protein LOC141601557 [Silene latifolia]|uniref:uncharacterized protein LOC141601557 n=1 Tax=Silene latifolia TaxID=37657 RepID=UPI003D76FBD1